MSCALGTLPIFNAEVPYRDGFSIARPAVPCARLTMTPAVSRPPLRASRCQSSVPAAARPPAGRLVVARGSVRDYLTEAVQHVFQVRSPSHPTPRQLPNIHGLNWYCYPGSAATASRSK